MATQRLREGTSSYRELQDSSTHVPGSTSAFGFICLQLLQDVRKHNSACSVRRVGFNKTIKQATHIHITVPSRMSARLKQGINRIPSPSNGNPALKRRDLDIPKVAGQFHSRTRLNVNLRLHLPPGASRCTQTQLRLQSTSCRFQQGNQTSNSYSYHSPIEDCPQD